MAEAFTPRTFVTKVRKDNITMLASVVSWGVLCSVIPIVVAIIALSGWALHDPARQHVVIKRLSQILQHSLSEGDLRTLVRVAVQHTGLLSVLGVLGILWGASNIGGAISTVFQPIFQVRGRPIAREKVIDIAMIFVFTALMLVIVTATTAVALVDRLLPPAQISTAATFATGTLISFLAALLLFCVLYTVFPNIEARFKRGHVWKGALVAALLFQILSYVWPLYVVLFHPQRYGLVFAPIIVLGVWIYFFALILVIGAEVVAYGSLTEAAQVGKAIGPAPNGTVPQRIADQTH